MLRCLKALPLVLAVVGLGIFAMSCSTSSARVRFVNAIQNTQAYPPGALDVEFNTIRDFTSVAFGAASNSTYTSVPSGSDTVEGLEAGTSTVIFTETGIGVNSGTQYTMIATGFASGTGQNVVLKTFPDTNTAPTAGNVNFRVINAAPDSPASVDIYIEPAPFSGSLTPPATITGLAYQSASNYVTLPWNSDGSGWLVYVCTAGSTIPSWINGQSITGGSQTTAAIRTIVLTDVANGTAINPTALVLNDLN